MSQARLPQRLNHIEVVLPRGTMTPEYLADVDSFYCGVFGWTPEDAFMPELNDLRQHRYWFDGNLVVLTEGDHPTPMPYEKAGLGEGETVAVTHVGLTLPTIPEVDRLLAECQEFQKNDPRVRLWDAGANKYGEDTAVLRAFLVMYLLPIWFDVNAFTEDPGTEPPQTWQFMDNPAFQR